MSPFFCFSLFLDIPSCTGEFLAISWGAVIINAYGCARVWRVDHFAVADIHADVVDASFSVIVRKDEKDVCKIT